ncbi:DUF2850 domain-containing protein [Vibrio brasiliensis]|uniref:DUF2850 domain-containing protein n=1 Tax=Vibrio brasiliensis TaxID=170652 RepID=UPI001EFED92E|nr:DUF2850 domain-containing protein [Vibrio brasiliensis]MCG9649177.1 DUF2850 domain-containing protein [Vibrio brasiliensis]MCG9725309.1 DUF2850 domain-containing protein [Vibrio brasiliensis]MCG9750168.1 DUF2850 domain-containing protein [Vibrio brasiliensis]MCG9781286.1 DUF2850 domain-containing protein [Vibrio brasiliensis]
MKEYRTVILVSLGAVCLVSMVLASYFMISQYRAKARAELMGEWVESRVAGYSAATVRIGKDGVYWDQHLVSTKYSFDGELLEFTRGGREQRFTFDMDKGTLVHLNGDYKAVFKKSE